MIQITFDKDVGYFLSCPMQVKANTVTLYFEGFSDNIDYSHGFWKWYKEAPDEAFKWKNMPVPKPRVLEDFSEFKYKWNVLTPMSNGIVLSDDPNCVETEEDNFHPLSDEEIEAFNQTIEAMVQNTPDQLSPEERIDALEHEVAELKASQK